MRRDRERLVSDNSELAHCPKEADGHTHLDTLNTKRSWPRKAEVILHSTNYLFQIRFGVVGFASKLFALVDPVFGLTRPTVKRNCTTSTQNPARRTQQFLLMSTSFFLLVTNPKVTACTGLNR
jgi:hypothetical protein